MADYYPLIAKAVAGLEKSTGEARRALYDRARSALVAQLRGVTPALNESDITRERLSLEEAIRKVETEAARRSRTDPPPRAAPAAPPARPARPDMPQPPQPQPSVEAVEMRPTPPQIRVSPPAAPMASEADPIGDGDGGIGVEAAPEMPAPPERPRWTPGSGGPSISDRGLKGFRDVVADGGEALAGVTAQVAKNARAAPGEMEPPSGAGFERAEPRVEAEPARPSARRPTPRDAERVLVRPPAPEPVRGREAREPRRSRDAEPPRPSSRRVEPPPPPSFLDAPGDQSGPAAPIPDLDDFELTRPPSSTVRQEDLRRPTTPRAPQPEKRREKRADKRPEKRPEPRAERRDDKRTDRWAEKPPEKKKSGLSALPLRKMAIVSVAALVVLSAVALALWNRSTIIGYFRGTPNLTRPAENRDNGARPKIADRIGGPSTSPSAEEGALVAQKVVLYEEDPNDPAGKRYVGSAVWRTESVPPAPGQPPDLAIRADIEIPEQKISARWSLRRNDDKALPASHTVEVMFTLPADFPHGGITNIPGVLMKQSESTRGVPLAGLAVKVTTNFFLIGLSSVEADRARNIQLLKERAWFDIPVVYNDGRRAIIAIEKGTPGDRAFARAFEAWGQ
jgi:hypothetical protein